MLQNLVFVKYNHTLKEQQDNDEKIYQLIMDDLNINIGSEWLLCDEVRQSDVVYDDDLCWLDVEVASRTAEPIFNTRSQSTL